MGVWFTTVQPAASAANPITNAMRVMIWLLVRVACPEDRDGNVACPARPANSAPPKEDAPRNERPCAGMRQHSPRHPGASPLAQPLPDHRLAGRSGYGGAGYNGGVRYSVWPRTVISTSTRYLRSAATSGSMPCPGASGMNTL